MFSVHHQFSLKKIGVCSMFLCDSMNAIVDSGRAYRSISILLAVFTNIFHMKLHTENSEKL